MPENEKPKLSAELLHQLLGEYVEKTGQTLRRHERIVSSLAGGAIIGTMASVLVLVVGLDGLSSSAGTLSRISTTFFVVLFLGAIWWIVMTMKGSKVVKQDLELSAWQLRRIYELASRYEDTGPEIEPALRTGMVLKLGEAQLLLTQLEKFEAKDGRFAEMRSLGPDPLQLRPREEVRTNAAPGLATTER